MPLVLPPTNPRKRHIQYAECSSNEHKPKVLGLYTRWPLPCNHNTGHQFTSHYGLDPILAWPAGLVLGLIAGLCAQ